MSSGTGIALLYQYLAQNNIDISTQDEVELLEAVRAQLEDEIIAPDNRLLEILRLIETEMMTEEKPKKMNTPQKR